MGKMLSEGSIPIYEARPSGEIKGGILLIHEVWGLADHIKDVADRYAKEGYLVHAPNFLSDTDVEARATPELQKALFNPKTRTAIQPQLRELMAPLQAPEFARITSDKVQVCFDKLFNLPEVKEEVAVIGYCFGGTYSFTLAANEPRLKAAVPYYGHADLTIDQMARIRCPILAFYGKNDERLLGMLPELEENMRQAGVDFTAVVYEGAGHAFFNDSNEYSYNEKAAVSAWNKTLKFLSENLVK